MVLVLKENYGYPWYGVHLFGLFSLLSNRNIVYDDLFQTCILNIYGRFMPDVEIQRDDRISYIIIIYECLFICYFI